MAVTPQLNRNDAHALACFFIGLSWQESVPSPFIHFMLSQLDANKTDNVVVLRQLLGADGFRQVLAVDPKVPLPTGNDDSELTVVPALPSDVQSTVEQLSEASKVGRWLDDYIEWAGATANETPLAFHEVEGLFLGAAAIARRLSIPPHGAKSSTRIST